jgi:signal transduction histidine kinase
VRLSDLPRFGDLPRTTSFRLSLLFLGLFGISSLLLFGFLYWQTTTYLGNSVDEWLVRDSLTYRADPAAVAGRLKVHAERDPENRRPFGLFDAHQRFIAGNLTRIPVQPLPFQKVFAFRVDHGDRSTPYRAIAYRLTDGNIFVLSEDVYESHEFSEMLLKALTWGCVLMFGIGIAGAVITGLGAVRRINGITGAVERIVTGDLTKRLPMTQGAGDLDRLVHLVNGMLDDIERLMREVKGVTDDIAHDLRTPLTRLLGGLERARRRASSQEEYAAAVDQAIAETKDVLGTFSALLRIAEVEDGARRAGFTKVSLAQVAADAVEFHAPVAEERGITLTLETDSPVSTELSGDPSLLFEALSNLVDNAIKFTPGGGRVRVRTFHGKGRCGVTVTDTGPGIPASERDAVVRRFHRLEKSRHTPGSGLGLSLVAAVAKLHGLALTIDSNFPGCSVTLTREEPASAGSATPATLDMTATA